MEDKTDKELYYEFLEGNNKSFDTIVLRHKNNLIYFLQKYVKSIEIAEDLAQDVFVYILIHKVKYDFNFTLKTYLYTIAKSKAINYLKREKRIVQIDENQINEINESEQLEEIVFRNEKIRNLRKSIKKLKSEYQDAIYLADIEGLSYKEIGRILNKNNTNVKVLIHRARKSLEKVIREEVV